MSENDEFDAEEALAASQEKKRHNQEPDAVDGDQEASDDEQLSGLAMTLVDVLEDDVSTRIQTRDEDLARILEGLERQQLDQSSVVEAAAELLEELGVDDPLDGQDVGDARTADLVRLLLEVGLRTVDEEIDDVDVVDSYRAAHREHSSSAF